MEECNCRHIAEETRFAAEVERKAMMTEAGIHYSFEVQEYGIQWEDSVAEVAK